MPCSPCEKVHSDLEMSERRTKKQRTANRVKCRGEFSSLKSNYKIDTASLMSHRSIVPDNVDPISFIRFPSDPEIDIARSSKRRKKNQSDRDSRRNPRYAYANIYLDTSTFAHTYIITHKYIFPVIRDRVISPLSTSVSVSFFVHYQQRVA